MEKCDKCNSSELKIGVTQIASGATVHPIYCNNCKEVFAKYVSKKIANEYRIKYGELENVKTRTAKYLEKRQQNITCEVCKKNEGELHHWAPQYLFKDEAEQWPKSYLCRSCHKKWHNLVTPNMSKT